MMGSGQVKLFCRRGIVASARRPRLYQALWHPLFRFCSLAQRAHFWDLLEVPPVEMQRALELFQAHTVLHGPFCGMKYPEMKSSGSAIYPKLIGSYERELHPSIETALRAPYSDVIDIGCAEGYYAVGFALRMPSSHVWACDTDANALAMCREMARLNSVESRMTFSGTCDARTLREMPVTGRALIICDCEGFEEVLFSAELCQRLATHDLIIEVHDFIRPFISQTLYARLAATHDVCRARSIPDSIRPDLFQYSELETFSPATRISLLAEMRPAEMQWLLCRSRSPRDVTNHR